LFVVILPASGTDKGLACCGHSSSAFIFPLLLPTAFSRANGMTSVNAGLEWAQAALEWPYLLFQRCFPQYARTRHDVAQGFE
jgi:hypothetical protein